MDSHVSNDTSDPAKATSRIYVGNLKKHILREDLEKLFTKYGSIQGISLHKGGFGFVQFKTEEEAEAAVKGEGGIFFKGCLLQLRVCSPQDPRHPGRSSSRERDRDYSSHDRRQDMDMGRDRSPIRRGDSYDDRGRDYKRDDRPPLGKPFDRSPPPRRGEESFHDRRFGRDDMRGYGGRDGPPPSFGRDDVGRPPTGPPRDFGRFSAREDRFGGPDGGRYGRDDPPPGRFGRDDVGGRYGGRDDYWGGGGRDDYPRGNSDMRYGRDDPPGGPGYSDLPSRGGPLGPPFRPEPPTELRKPNDCEIIVLQRQNRNYAEMVERRLKNLGLQVDLLFLKDEALLSRALEDLTQQGTLFAAVVTEQHEVHGSVTINILYGVPQEHRNMPLDDALKLVSRNFREHMENRRAGNQDEPDRELQFLFKLLLDGKYLSVPELDRIIQYLTERRDKQLLQERGEPVPQRVERPKPEEEKPSQQELQQRILSMIGQPGPVSPLASQASAIVQAQTPAAAAAAVAAAVPALLQPPQQQANPEPTASTYINFDNPSVQKALDNLIHNGSSLLKTLSSANPQGGTSHGQAETGTYQEGDPGFTGYGDGFRGGARGINSGYSGQQQVGMGNDSNRAGPNRGTPMRHPLLGTQVPRPLGRPGPPRY
uniref:Putative nuclear receptor coactivator 5 strongylocentrotus purpuratus n=3 Tax=Ornithodoros turicata TaxID=34597 RepID=A0A2R5L602_9ACAR